MLLIDAEVTSPTYDSHIISSTHWNIEGEIEAADQKRREILDTVTKPLDRAAQNGITMAQQTLWQMVEHFSGLSFFSGKSFVS